MSFQPRLVFVAFALVFIAGCAQQMGAAAPSVSGAAVDLVPLSSLAPGVRQDMRYATRHNFMGRPVEGYEAGVCWLSRAAAQSLAAVQKELAADGLAIKVYDCYRPQAAVNDFVRWGRDLADQKNKDMYYPRVPKSELFKRGYIAEKSGHSRASTVDMTLVVVDATRAAKRVRGPLADGIDVDMGTPFDMFDEQSHTEDASQSPDVQHNRLWLRALMQSHGWKNLPEEWWHYTLVSEPYPDQYFNQPVRKN
ncbi:MAG: M15 family metallopeptidase [Comamonas sp.]|jgi:D-alanyl-D-alanine dipeptidase|uniref:M15 family metallopeptidase n=1 Tax=Comamonas sp. TaxID=34028 RepID=UPI00281854C9|nr:M15 family metallopeptidase [Comamonas sp.]MDR0216356.1 M15 family metallopeptidase [Comamonas sp.]MDR2297890.1 M15 family metallopeptidase [Comamonas sp.]